MAGSTRSVLEATRLLCGKGGSMSLQELHRELGQSCSLTEDELCSMVLRCRRFLLVPSPERGGRLRAERCTVMAQTSLRLCRSYIREERCSGCENLHLCKFFIYGTCRFGKGRKPCKFSHNVQSDHNHSILRDCSLHELNEDELFLLLLQNDSTLLPEVCAHYNKGSAPEGCCTFQTSCTKLHLCQHFLQGDCMFGPKCLKSHTIDEHGCRMLEERGLSGDVIHDLPIIYRNSHHLRAAAAADDADAAADAAAAENFPDLFCNSSQTDEDNTICLHFIRNSCKFRDDCLQVHFHLPYKWEVFNGSTWTDLANMEDIERDFCDPSMTRSGRWPIDFETMTLGMQLVRRLSTVSSVKRPPHYTLTTEWLWYYKGEHRNWVEYGQLDEKQRSTSVASETLEKAFQSDRTAEVPVVKGPKHYIVSFKDMYQRNPKHNTRRRIRRRPRFVSEAQVKVQVDLLRNRM
ncbi:protein mono-ADP-ribosyltransferase PARP12b isoform 2-T3 [Pholidichthys leucotaenia]